MPDQLDQLFQEVMQERNGQAPAAQGPRIIYAPGAQAPVAQPSRAAPGALAKPESLKVEYQNRKVNGDMHKIAQAIDPSKIPVGGIDLGPTDKMSMDPQAQPYGEIVDDARGLAAGINEIAKQPYFANISGTEMSHQNTTFYHSWIAKRLQETGLSGLSTRLGGPAGEVDPKWAEYLGAVGQLKGKLMRVYMGGRPSERLVKYISQHFVDEWNTPRDNALRANSLLNGILHGRANVPFSEAETGNMAKLKGEGYDDDEAAAIVKMNRAVLGDGSYSAGEKF